MKYILILTLLLFSCQKEKTECFCKKQYYRYKHLGGGMYGHTFDGYSPYYRTECNKGGEWYDMDSTVRFFLICDI